jgi:hypothetical protein
LPCIYTINSKAAEKWGFLHKERVAVSQPRFETETVYVSSLDNNVEQNEGKEANFYASNNGDCSSVA